MTGTEEKCQWLRNDLGFDNAINFKKENVDEISKIVILKMKLHSLNLSEFHFCQKLWIIHLNL